MSQPSYIICNKQSLLSLSCIYVSWTSPHTRHQARSHCSCCISCVFGVCMADMYILLSPKLKRLKAAWATGLMHDCDALLSNCSKACNQQLCSHAMTVTTVIATSKAALSSCTHVYLIIPMVASALSLICLFVSFVMRTNMAASLCTSCTLISADAARLYAVKCFCSCSSVWSVLVQLFPTVLNASTAVSRWDDCFCSNHLWSLPEGFSLLPSKWMKRRADAVKQPHSSSCRTTVVSPMWASGSCPRWAMA